MDKYEYIVNSSSDFITLINRGYVYELVNTTYCKEIEKSREDILGFSVEEVWGGERFYGTIKKKLDRCLAGETVHYIEQFSFGSFSKYMHISYLPFRENGKITHALVVSHDITHLGELENKLNHYEYRDPVTGLFNRRSLNVILDREIERSARARDQQLQVLLCIELRKMEKIFQVHGQEIGDLLLENTGLRIKAQLRASDYVFRFEGNRFAVLLPKVENKLDAGTVAKKIHAAVTTPYSFPGGDTSISCSIGAALFPDDGDSRDALIQNALSTMMEAGKTEKEFLLFNPNVHKKAIERLSLESAAYQGLKSDQFFISYQAIVDTRDHRIIGAEALLRWTHPELGAISPQVFIPIAEQSKLILTIGKWVLFRVCRDLAKWSEEYGIFVSINISAREFSSPQLKENIVNAISHGGLRKPEFLKLEITETACLHNVDATISTMRFLDDLGVHMYIDDFGTGQASLMYLKKLPVRVLKIDKAFIDDIGTDSREKVFLSHIIQIIKSRGKKVVAEGVEDAHQAELLAKMGCDHMQGYYFSRPLPRDDFEALLSRTDTLPFSPT